MSDHKGAVLLFSSLPHAKILLGDKGYDSDWFRAALASQDIALCIPPKTNTTTTSSSIASVTRSKTCSEGSRTGDPSQPDTNDAPTSPAALLLRSRLPLASLRQAARVSRCAPPIHGATPSMISV